MKLLNWYKYCTRDQAFGAAVDVHVKRIAAGDVYNEYTLFVNGNAVLSNKVVTHTPEPANPTSTPTPTPTSTSTIAKAAPKAPMLPRTGDKTSYTSMFVGLGLLVAGLFGFKQREERQ
ncbi:LPXTG cell wall anchor domain-containing protein [Streptococcus sp. HF-1907]|uniref:LPXTG cell wall anchor domain-containing protein n=1 Tax=Streptococcus sp. HF-1907 TaxID=2785793 RepID=UPI0018A095AA|nr:LPXTG cell wall anchor domain-containing protein [Streptococcus sp. HF-1907]MBF7094466.1 LPXTG cell wall anchor domain-containing protein [Streptococcus sp. HF-1907]